MSSAPQLRVEDQQGLPAMAARPPHQQTSTSLVPMVPLVARDFHCSEVSEPIPPSQRAEREAMKREAQRQRMEAAKITNYGRDGSVLADRQHLPIQWPTRSQTITRAGG